MLLRRMTNTTVSRDAAMDDAMKKEKANAFSFFPPYGIVSTLIGEITETVLVSQFPLRRLVISSEFATRMGIKNPIGGQNNFALL